MDTEDVRLAVYDRLAASAPPPSPAELAEHFDAPEEHVRAALRELADTRHLVLDPDDAVVMAHPFTVRNLGFAVMGRDRLWWGGCAWDSFAMPFLLPDQAPVLVATRCPACDRALAWNVGTDAPPAGDEVAHFLVPAAHMWDDVLRTCGNQRLFCSDGCVHTWLHRSKERFGSMIDLETLWRLARGWYSGRLDRGYRRREPAQAADYLRSAGLTGDFWGVP